MGVTSEWMGDQFEKGFYDAIGDELVKSANILRRELSLVLTKTGKSPPPSPKGTPIPYNRTGNLAGSWHSSSSASRSGSKFTAVVYTKVMYALYLVKRTGSGKRDYMQTNLYWYQKTVAMIKKRLDPQRLIRAATRNFRF